MTWNTSVKGPLKFGTVKFLMDFLLLLSLLHTQ